jgi:hypothetical protein
MTCDMRPSRSGSAQESHRRTSPSGLGGVEVLLRVYTKCLHGGEEIASKRIEAALAGV